MWSEKGQAGSGWDLRTKAQACPQQAGVLAQQPFSEPVLPPGKGLIQRPKLLADSSFLLVIVATFWVLARDKTLLSALLHHSFSQPSATRLEVGAVTHSPIL